MPPGLGARQERAGSAPPATTPDRVPPSAGGGIPQVFSPMYDPAMDGESTLGTRLHRLNVGVGVAVAAVSDRVDVLAQRAVWSEAAYAALRTDARLVLDGVVDQARQEFGRQRKALVTLRDGAMQEAATARARLDETRDAVEQLYAGARSEVANLREAAMTLGQRAADLETSQVAGANAVGPSHGG